MCLSFDTAPSLLKMDYCLYCLSNQKDIHITTSNEMYNPSRKVLYFVFHYHLF